VRVLLLGAFLLMPMVRGGVPSRFEHNEPAALVVGIELPSQVPFSPVVEAALRDMGIGYAGFYVTTHPGAEAPEEETAAAMVDLCRRLGLRFTLDAHHRDPGERSVRTAFSAGPLFHGVLFDELTHVRLLYPEFAGPAPDAVLADPKTFADLLDAHQKTVEALQRLQRRFAGLGAPRVISTEVWPSLLHAAARAGMVPCPKICKEFYSPVSLAVGMGAALQYDRELWVDVDMWYFTTIPGHPPEEVRSNLLLAYWLGADLVYLEGCGYNLLPAGRQGHPFSLVHPLDDHRYQLTPHGEMLKEFCTRYLPSHPRPWSFRDVLPDAAIIRFDDTDVGQKSWGVEQLYGSKNLRPGADTAAWLSLWNVLTHGKTGSDGLAWFKGSVRHPDTSERYHRDITPSYLTERACQDHTFFVPLRGVVVFDHLVPYEKLRGIPVLFLTGKHVSEETMRDIRRRVSEGAVCVAWGPLAARNGFSWRKGVQVVRHGRGKFVLTDDFQAPKAVRHYRNCLGRSDEICYRFRGGTVTLRRVTDNTVDVHVAPNTDER